MKHALAAAVIAASISFAGNSFAVTSTVHYQSGFEPETYTVGTLIGQDSWFGLPPVNALVAVQNTVVATGTQAVKIGAANSEAGGTWALQFVDLDTTQTAAEPYVRVQWDMNLPTLGETEVASGLWGVDLYTIGVSRLAYAGIMESAGDLFLTVSGADEFTVALGAAPARNTWNTYAMILNYGNQTFDFEVNGVVQNVAPLPFITGAGVGADATLGDFDLFVTAPGNDSAYFDNVSVTSSTVPEPATLSLLALGGLAGLRRQRRSSGR
jgi:hypothetical protein